LQWLCASVAVTLANSLELLRRAVPEGPAGASMLTELAVRVDRVKQAKLRSQLLQLALEREPHQLRAHETIASDLIAELPSSAPGQRCHDRAACLRRIEQHLRAVREAAPDQPTAIILRARLLLAQKRPAEAERLLADNCGRYAGLPGCWHERVIAADQMTPADRLDEAMSAYLASACSRPADCAGAADWLGDIRAQRGDWAAAATKYERAAREEPTPERWLKLADAATRAGQLGRASQALRRARQGGAKADPKLERRLEEAIEQQLLRNLDRGRQK
jgi:predicted Zn-dependent protease